MITDLNLFTEKEFFFLEWFLWWIDSIKREDFLLSKFWAKGKKQVEQVNDCHSVSELPITAFLLLSDNDKNLQKWWNKFYFSLKHSQVNNKSL